jgi:hypothetical protein
MGVGIWQKVCCKKGNTLEKITWGECWVVEIFIAFVSVDLHGF